LIDYCEQISDGSDNFDNLMPTQLQSKSTYVSLRSLTRLLGVTMTSSWNHVIAGGGRPEAVQRMRSRRRNRMRSSPSGLMVARGRLAAMSTDHSLWIFIC